MEGKQTGTALCMELVVQDLWVSGNSISSELLRDCVRVGRSIWTPQRICHDSEGTLAVPGGLSHHRPQVSDTVPGGPSSPVECLPPLLRPLPLKELAVGPGLR